MSLDEILAKVKRYDENATVIFDRDEPVGRPTDLVLPAGRRWFRRRGKVSPPRHSAGPTKRS